MLGSDVMRGYNDMLILCLLCEGDSYGYAISREIERRSGGAYPIKCAEWRILKIVVDCFAKEDMKDGSDS